MPTAGVDFFRVDRSGATKRLLVIAACMIALGATTVGAHLMHRFEPRVGHLISLGGGLTLLAGLVLGFGSMAMLLFENVYLLIREGGVVLHENGKEVEIAWNELEEVTVEEPGTVVFQRAGEASVRWFAGKVAKDVHLKVADARRKALHGLLRAPS